MSCDDLRLGLRAIKAESAEARAAFMFKVFDVLDMGAISRRDLNELIEKTPGGPTEADLFSLVRYVAASKGKAGGGKDRKQFIVFDEYWAHVQADGESATMLALRDGLLKQ